MPLDRKPIIVGHWLARQPGAAADVEQIGVRTLRDQVRMQDRMLLILDPGPMPHDLIAPRGQPAHSLGSLDGLAQMVSVGFIFAASRIRASPNFFAFS
ncbi:hypothetical protein [Mesorhizobium sp.]|uniref:hypothetical protein n=1 Tax=Mesorhizobium sp. TaxID=1871066 RepID=UPI00257DDC38|nr:hypothetical protein [Mesorhizobium sp.]